MKSLVRALIYAGFACLTFKVISGAQGSQTKKQQDLTATAMHHTGGRWLVGLVGLIIVIAGLTLVFEGIRRKLLKYLQTSRMRPRTRRLVEWLGVIGTAARGVVFALAGVLVIEAAVTYQPAKPAASTRRCSRCAASRSASSCSSSRRSAWPSSASTACARRGGEGSSPPERKRRQPARGSSARR